MITTDHLAIPYTGGTQDIPGVPSEAELTRLANLYLENEFVQVPAQTPDPYAHPAAYSGRTAIPFPYPHGSQPSHTARDPSPLSAVSIIIPGKPGNATGNFPFPPFFLAYKTVRWKVR